MTKILVIDDDDFVRKLICNALKKAGFEVLDAVDGNDGIKKLHDERSEIIITDILMPDKEGIETIMEIKAMDSNIKIIAMSSGGSSKNMSFLNMAKKVGAPQILSKPFNIAELLEAVNAVQAG